jgi:hypothetical protein
MVSSLQADRINRDPHPCKCIKAATVLVSHPETKPKGVPVDNNPMKKNNLLATILVTLFFLSGPASGGPPKDKTKGKTKIAILELKAERGLDEGLVKLLNELLLTEFGRSGEL